MNVYDKNGDPTNNFEKTFLGDCKGIALSRRGKNDKHIIINILTEDDESWFVSNNGFSNYWLSDLEDVIKRVKKWMKNNCTKTEYGYEFKNE